MEYFLEIFFSYIKSLTVLLLIRSEEKQIPNVSEEQCNMEIFFLLMDGRIHNIT